MYVYAYTTHIGQGNCWLAVHLIIVTVVSRLVPNLISIGFAFDYGSAEMHQMACERWGVRRESTIAEEGCQR